MIYIITYGTVFLMWGTAVWATRTVESAGVRAYDKARVENPDLNDYNLWTNAQRRAIHKRSDLAEVMYFGSIAVVIFGTIVGYSV